MNKKECLEEILKDIKSYVEVYHEDEEKAQSLCDDLQQIVILNFVRMKGK
jgi:hypothetical protein